jgi:hypothetical protein
MNKQLLLARAWMLTAAIAAGCSSIDESLLFGDDAGRPSSQDAGGRTPPAGSGGTGPGVGVADASGPDVDGGSDGGKDAAEPGTSPDPNTCHANPDAFDEVCPMICPEACNGDDDDCDRRIDEGDAVQSCDLDHATAVCHEGACVVAKCEDGWRDCDAKDNSGCETAVDTVAHCGRCDVDCDALDHVATAACSPARECEVVACDMGWGDCDADPDTGCEASLTTTSDCGGCASFGANETCEGLADTAMTSCGSGVCAVDQCALGFGNCDGLASTGCERDETMDGSCLPAPTCVKLSFGDADYYFCPGPATWDQARAACRVQSRGDLVSIDDIAEGDFVAMTLGFDAWIGASDAVREGLWRWVQNAVPFWSGGAGGAALLGNFELWGTGEPAGASGTEDCGLVRAADGSWGAEDCAVSHGFVCEEIPDRCPADSVKLDPGQCGCGTDDTDADMDGFAACNDACEADALKVTEGACGCGVPDTDTDADLTPDCDDACPDDPTKQVGPCGTCFGDALNFLPDDVALAFDHAVVIDCAATFDSAVPDFTTWCSGTKPVPVVQTQSGGPDLVVVPMTALTVAAGSTLRVIGNKPVVFAVAGDATIDGTLDAGATGTTPGAGGDSGLTGTIATAGTLAGPDCNVFANGTGQGMESGTLALGGGGAGFRTNGGFGGGERANFRCYNGSGATGGGANGYECKDLCPVTSCDNSYNNSSSRYKANNNAHYTVSPARGLAAPDQDLSPLRAGCAGGKGEGTGTFYGGAGGGAVQLVVANTFAMGTGGIVSAGGGGGRTSGGRSGGAGGGSGGAILIEASDFTLASSAAIRAHGGSGAGRYANSSNDCTSGSGLAEDGHSANDNYATAPSANCVSEGRGGLSYWNVPNATCNGSMAAIGSSVTCTLPNPNWPADNVAYPQGGNDTDNNGGGGGGGSGGVIVVRRLTLAGVCN